MPLYEYECSSCKKRFEVLQRMGDGPEGLECPECGSNQVRKQLSTFASTVGGSGIGGSFAGGGGCGPAGSGFS